MPLLLSALTEVSQNLRASSSFGSAGCSGLLQKISQPQRACPRGDTLSFLGTETSQKRAQSWVFSGWRSVKWSRMCPCNGAEALLLGWSSPAQRRVVDTVDQTQPSWEWESRLKYFCVAGECLDISRANWTDTDTFSAGGILHHWCTEFACLCK